MFFFLRGLMFGLRFLGKTEVPAAAAFNPLRAYFDGHSGRGINKRVHYLDIYHRHLRKFVGASPVVLEIGVQSGGSLIMWKEYFGAGSQIHGVDVQKSCSQFQDTAQGVFISIGSQGDRKFWADFKSKTPRLDVIIDDGSHHWEDQIATFEEMLEHLKPGGVYICEDLKSITNNFVLYTMGFASNLNVSRQSKRNGVLTVAPPTPLQRTIRSVHFYPLVVVVEKNFALLESLLSTRHGTEWIEYENSKHNAHFAETTRD